MPLMCHGDVSARNVLTGKGGRLFLVDPRGLSGDAAYDVAVAALKAMVRGAPSSVASHLANSVGVDPDRVRAWMIVADAARVWVSASVLGLMPHKGSTATQLDDMRTAYLGEPVPGTV
jgi:streptomycin 6-kinase